MFSVTVPVTKFHSETQAWFAPASMHLPAKLSQFQDLKTPETVEKSRDSRHLSRETLTTRRLNIWLGFDPIRGHCSTRIRLQLKIFPTKLQNQIFCMLLPTTLQNLYRIKPKARHGFPFSNGRVAKLHPPPASEIHIHAPACPAFGGRGYSQDSISKAALVTGYFFMMMKHSKANPNLTSSQFSIAFC